MFGFLLLFWFFVGSFRVPNLLHVLLNLVQLEVRLEATPLHVQIPSLFRVTCRSVLVPN